VYETIQLSYDRFDEWVEEDRILKLTDENARRKTERKKIWESGVELGPMTSPGRRGSGENMRVNFTGKRKVVEQGNLDMNVSPKRVALGKKVVSESMKRRLAEKLKLDQEEQANWEFNGFGNPNAIPKRVAVVVSEEEPQEAVQEKLEIQAVVDPKATLERVTVERNVAEGAEEANEAKAENLEIDGFVNPASTPKRKAMENKVVSEGPEAEEKADEIDGFVNPASSPLSSPNRVAMEIQKVLSDGAIPNEPVDLEIDGFMNPAAVTPKKAETKAACESLRKEDAEQVDLEVNGFENPAAATIKKAAPKRLSKKFTAPLVTSKRLAKIKAQSLVRQEDMVDYYFPAGTKRAKGDTAVIFIHGGYFTRLIQT
jgi:hypothetical protein